MKRSNIELLRIIAFWLVCCIHITSIIIVNPIFAVGTTTWYYAVAIRTISAPAIIIYILISGYLVGISKKPKDTKKTIKRLLLPLFLYFPIIAICDVFINTQSIIDTINNFLQFEGFFYHLWYVVVYILIVFISYNILPYIRINKKISLKVVLTLIFLISIGFTMKSIFNYSFLIFKYLNSNIIYIFLMFMLGVIIGKYDIKINKKVLIIIYLLSVFATMFIYIYLQKKDCIKAQDFLISYSNLFYFFSASSLFMFFKELNIKSKIINSIGSLTYGAYLSHVLLIHYLRNYIYQYSNHYASKYYFLFDASFVLLIFAVSLFVEYIRQNLTKIIKEKIPRKT